MKTSLRTFKKYWILSLLLRFTVQSCLASSGTEGAAFLDIPVGAGPASMGSAYTSLANNAYAPVYNPAGLASLSGHEVAAQHLSYLESMHYEHMSYVMPISGKNGVSTRGLGFSVQYLGSGDIAATSDTGASIGYFSSHYASYNVSYGQTVTRKLSLGATAKIIHAKIDDLSARAYATDLGSMYKMSDRLTFSGALTNIGTKLKFIQDRDALPMAIKVSAAFKPAKQWVITSEGVYRINGLGSVHVGGQWRVVDSFSLRAGYKTDTLKGLNALAGVTAGFGIQFLGQELAYAWSPYGDLGDAQYVSLLIRFGAAQEAKRNLIQYRTIRSHQSVKNNGDKKEDLEPEYQQLMQLLSDSDVQVAQKR